MEASEASPRGKERVTGYNSACFGFVLLISVGVGYKGGAKQDLDSNPAVAQCELLCQLWSLHNNERISYVSVLLYGLRFAHRPFIFTINN